MKRVDGELAVSRALGDFQFKDPKLPPEATKVTANPDMSVVARSDTDEFIVLACDGIWDVMSNEEVIESVGRYFHLGESSAMLVSEELIEDCLAKGSKDNMSALTLVFEAGRQRVRNGLSPDVFIDGLKLQSRVSVLFSFFLTPVFIRWPMGCLEWKASVPRGRNKQPPMPLQRWSLRIIPTRR
jgi:hypothetical protein